MNEDIAPCRIAVVGRGRLGNALALALHDAGERVEGPLGRGETPSPAAEAILLCVPDAEIAAAAAAAPPGPLLGHCSGASGLDALGGREGFSLHPLMTLIDDPHDGARRLRGAGAAIAGTTPRALASARRIAERLALEPFELADEDRVAYHAAATFASNFLVALEGAAERLAATAGLEPRMLVPLVRATVENWAAVGAERALTGPIARGDEQTVARQREAVAGRAPELLPLFDELCAATRRLAIVGAATR